MTLCLIVNPAAGGGRARRALPSVQSALTGHGFSHRLTLTESLEHARALAREAAGAGETAVAFGGDGLIGAVAGETARCQRRARSAARGARQRLRACPGHTA